MGRAVLYNVIHSHAYTMVYPSLQTFQDIFLQSKERTLQEGLKTYREQSLSVDAVLPSHCPLILDTSFLLF